jgi:hypothetical protein
MHKPYLKLAIWAALVIVAVQVSLGVAAYFFLPDWPTRGQFGDVFGAVNSLFSGFAFAGLIYAILLQREDLELQRKELEMTRKELTRSAAAQEQSEIALRAQAEAASQSARLSATNFLLEHYKSELASMRRNSFTANDPRLVRMQELERRTQVLVDVLDNMFIEVSNEGGNDGTQDR